MVGLLSLWVGGCGNSESGPAQQNTGSGGGGGAGAAGGAGPACGDLSSSLSSDGCGECAEAGCCPELSACDLGSPCHELFLCRAACTDEACADSCDATHAVGVDAYAALATCLAGTCADACAVSSGVCGSQLTTSIPGCDECLSASCCGELDDCLSDANCAACAVGDPSAESCDTDPFYVAFFETCAGASCSTVCVE